MELFLYQRPREKIIAHGASSLQTVELLQVLIGSGSAALSSASIARSVEEYTKVNVTEVTYADLLAIPGIGQARACLLLAAFELGERLCNGGIHQ